MKKRIVAFTSIRSDYDLLSPLFMLMRKDPGIDLKLIVSGAHLSKTYGYSVDQIKADRMPILGSFETLIDSDSRTSRIKTASILLQNCVDTIAKFSPDAILFSGDREDAIVAALVGAYLGIPTIHFYGGDHASDGNVDNAVRHSCSKLASLHLVSNEIHMRRLVRLGENPSRIFIIGSIALDKFVNHKPIAMREVFRAFGMRDGFETFCLVIYHPVLHEDKVAHLHFRNIMEVLSEERINAFVSYPNTDSGNKDIISVLDSYMDNGNFRMYRNLDRALFLTIFKRCSFVIGNSSAGLTEAATIPVPAINVGTRQVGRLADRNVIFCAPTKESIRTAIRKAGSKSFRQIVADVRNSYGDGRSARRALRLIKGLDLQGFAHKKEDPLDV